MNMMGEEIMNGFCVGTAEPCDVDGRDGTLLCKIPRGIASSGAGFESFILAGDAPTKVASTAPSVPEPE
jgi:hypothetical protein